MNLHYPTVCGMLKVMNDIQEKLAELQGDGWTLAAIADEVGASISAVEKWKSGERYPGMPKSILIALDSLGKRKPTPRRRYPGTHHLQRKASDSEDV